MRHMFFAFISGFGLFSSAARAEEAQGMATPWQLGFQEAASPVMEHLARLHDGLLMWTITGITLFVLLATLYICVRFHRRNHPVSSKTTHNTLREVAWTVVPVCILVAIAIPSLRVHYFMERAPEAEMTLKVTGRQWYWSYEYPDFGNFGFDSYMVKDEELKPGQVRLLEVDNRVVVPVDTVVRVQLTGADVIHSWAVPAFGVKKDAMPGRLNETWFKATQTGVFYGQCSELCGVGHGFMPIAVDVVSKEAFSAWVKGKQKEAGLPARGAVKTTQGADTVPVPQKAVAPESAQEPKPEENAPQAPATPKAAEKAPLDKQQAPLEKERKEPQ